MPRAEGARPWAEHLCPEAALRECALARAQARAHTHTHTHMWMKSTDVIRGGSPPWLASDPPGLDLRSWDQRRELATDAKDARNAVDAYGACMRLTQEVHLTQACSDLGGSILTTV